VNIALISDALTVGGAERQILLSAVELGRLGHTVKLIIYHPYVEFQDFIRRYNIDLVEIKSRGLSRLSRIRALAKYLRENNFDVVHAFKGCAPISGSLAAKWAGIESVFGGFRGIYNEGIVLRLAHNLADRLLTGWIVNSRAVADSMVTVLGIDRAKIFVVHNGISQDTFRSDLSKSAAKRRIGLPEDRLTVTIIARLDPVKNHRLFLRIASMLLRRQSDIMFLIAGDGPLRSDLEDQAKSLGIYDQVLFLGNRSDIPDVLAATDVSVLTSDSEGFPNVLIESMSVGVPVVSTNYPSINELIVDGEHGFITSRNDAATVAAKVAQLLDDADLRAHMGQNGRKMVQERFSAEVMAKNLVAVYEHARDESARY